MQGERLGQMPARRAERRGRIVASASLLRIAGTAGDNAGNATKEQDSPSAIGQAINLLAAAMASSDKHGSYGQAI
eukprot:541230-Pyramimonas_sp.AAC.1